MALLVVIHVLGILGSPVAASLHLWAPENNGHQNFHVVWEAFKYATASLFAVALVLGPLRRGERWALWVMALGSFLLFGGVFIAEVMTRGGPVIDFWSYGSFLVLSTVALTVIARLPPEERGTE